MRSPSSTSPLISAAAALCPLCPFPDLSLYFRETARQIPPYFRAALSDVLSTRFNRAAALCIHAWLHSVLRQKGKDLTDDRIKR